MDVQYINVLTFVVVPRDSSGFQGWVQLAMKALQTVWLLYSNP